MKSPEMARILRLAESVAAAVKDGYETDPGHSDLDNEQPIRVRLTLGDYRHAVSLFYAIKEK